MKIVKRILLGIVAIIVLLLIAGIFISKDFSAEKEVIINKPNDEVFAYIRMLKNQGNYSVWAMKDPGMKKTYTGTDGTVGFISAWEGNSDVGKGEQEIKKIEDGRRVDFELRFKKPWESVAPSWMTTEPVTPAQTKVKWGISGEMAYPFNVMKIFMSTDKMFGKDLQQGLDNLKAKLEAAP